MSSAASPVFGAHLRRRSPVGKRPWRTWCRAVLQGVVAARTWRAVLYEVVGLAVSIPGFALVVVSSILGLGLAVTFLGLPLLAVGGVGAVAVGGWHRRLAAKILDEPVAGAKPRPAHPGFLGWLQARLLDGRAWRARLYLLLKLPLMFATLYVAVILSIEGGFALLYPVLWRLSASAPRSGYRPTHIGWTLGRGATVSTPHPLHSVTLQVSGVLLNSWPLAVAACLGGGLVLLAVPWVVRAMAQADVRLMRSLLGPTPGALRVERLEAARSVVAEDAAATLRRIERDLHDGTQSQLIALAMNLGDLKDRLEANRDGEHHFATLDLVTTAHHQTKEALIALRNIASGIHPPALDVGLDGALATLTARSAVPTVLHTALTSRPADAIETIAYYTVAELLANVAKHSNATRADVHVSERGRRLILTVTDDGRGGADPAGGTGLHGLADRLDAVDGSLTISSPPGGPTVIIVELPFKV
jgi:signal transduction histidine kinase